MNRKIRTAIVTLVTALTVAVAIAPVASAARGPVTGIGENATVAPTDRTSARHDNGGYVDSAEALRKAQETCAVSEFSFESSLDQVEDRAKRGDWVGVSEAVADAVEMHKWARLAGCGWAQ